MYTKQDLEAIERAIIDLQTGKRVTSVRYGDTWLEYANISLDNLLKLRSQLLASLEDVGKPTIRRAIFSTSKGVQ